jgi:hypothetical protein
MPRSSNKPAAPVTPLKIVIVDRPHKGYTRYFENLHAMEAILSKYGLEYQIVDLAKIPKVKGTHSFTYA